MTEIVHRPLTQSEAVLVHLALKDTPNILGYTVRELTRLSDVYAAEEDGQFAGVCFSVDLRQNWTEIAALCVLPEFRGRGIGRALFDAAWERAQERRRHVYMLSRNPQVIGWMQARGMDVGGKFRDAPPAVHWYMASHMASGYRMREGFRKRKTIGQCPALLQGIKKHAPEAAGETASPSVL